MFYPVYIHKDPDSAYGAIVPDLPGVVSAAYALEDLPAALQEAAELRFEGETRAPGPASPIEHWQANADFQGGFWMVVDIDVAAIGASAVRVDIHLPEQLVGRIDAVAKARRLSRSAFIAIAAEHEIQADPGSR